MTFPEDVKGLSAQCKSNISFSDEVKGIDMDKDFTLDDLLESYKTTGIQANHLYLAIKEIKRMIETNSKIFFGCTSNIISSGLREIVCYLARNKFIEVFVCTAGGIEEDIIKCLRPTYCASFNLNGKDLRDNGWNRIGNMAIHNENYIVFEEFMNDFLDHLVKDHSESNPRIITPSEFIYELGKKINNEESVLYWCYKNNINVYSPAITDGSIGDMISFYKKRKSLKIDIVEDIKAINSEADSERENGAIIVGCGLIKHHIFNANLFNNGLNYCVLVNTAMEYDGSDAGATINEAVSWGKVRPDTTSVKVHGEASLILPLLIYGGFKSNRKFN